VAAKRPSKDGRGLNVGPANPRLFVIGAECLAGLGIDQVDGGAGCAGYRLKRIRAVIARIIRQPAWTFLPVFGQRKISAGKTP